MVPPDGDVLVCPGRDTEVRAGDEVTIIATPAELRATAAISYSERARHSLRPHTARWGVVSHLRDVAMSLLRAADRRLAIALGALVAVLVTATIVLRFTYQYAGPGHHISLLDSVYFTVETVTTVGYGDFTFRGEPSWLVVFAILLMMTGGLFVAVFFALVTNILVSRRIEESLGQAENHRAARPRAGDRPRHGRPAGRAAAARPRAGTSWWSRWTSTTGTSARCARSASLW